jgi:hypothetical protein
MFTSNNFKSNKNTRLIQGFSLAILGIGLLGSFSVHAEKYYKWVDDAGSTHYTQTPPPKAYIKKSVLVDIIPTPPSSTPPAPVITDLNQLNGNTAPANNQFGNNQPANSQQPNTAQLQPVTPAVPKANY